jgi:hypothetical protein
MKVDLYETITRLKKFKRERKSIESDLRHLVIDKDISLDDRWEIFLDSEMGETIGERDFPHVSVADMYNRMNIYRFDVYDVDELLEHAINCSIIYKDEIHIINQFKEFCLDNFIMTVEFDNYE